MISRDSVLRRRSDVRYRVVQGEAVVVVQDAAEVLAVNQVGARVLDLVDGRRSVGGILDVLVAEFDVLPERLEADVLRYLGELLEAKVVEPV